MSKTVTILYFARIREALETEAETVTLSDDVRSVSDLLSTLFERGERWQNALSSSQLLIAVNQEMTSADTLVADGDEVAFFPPVTGG